METDKPVEQDIDTSLDLQLPIPAWMAAKGGMNLAFRRRSEKFMQGVQEQTGLDYQSVEQRVADGQPLTDVFLTGMMKAVSHGDPAWDATFVRLVASAFRTDVDLDSVSFVMRRMEAFTPVHMRTFWSFCTLGGPGGTDDPDRLATDLVGRVRGERVVVLAAFADLQQMGFVSSRPATLTDVGRLALQVIGGIDETLTRAPALAGHS